MAWASREAAREYNRNWAKAHPEAVAAKRKKYRAAHRDEWNAYQRKWREENLEHTRAWHRENYRKRRDEIIEQRRAWRAKNRDAINARKRERYALKKKEREEKDMTKEQQFEQCPKCGAAGGAKVQGRLYVSGCTNPRCRYFLWREEATTAETLAAAVAGWNELARTLREELGEKAVPAPAPEKEARQDASPPFAGEPPAPPGETVETDEASAAEEAPKRKRGRPRKVAGEPAGEPPAPPEEEAADEEEADEEGVRFLVEVDGTFYWLEEGSEGCEGCAFQSGFGRRTFCGAESVEGLEQASALCRSLAGIWRENEEE